MAFEGGPRLGGRRPEHSLAAAGLRDASPRGSPRRVRGMGFRYFEDDDLLSGPPASVR